MYTWAWQAIDSPLLNIKAYFTKVGHIRYINYLGIALVGPGLQAPKPQTSDSHYICLPVVTSDSFDVVHVRAAYV